MARILLLEDDDGLRFLVETGLRELGHKVSSFSNIADAVQGVEDVRPELLILDLMIGQDYSLEVAEMAAFIVPNAEVIFATGSGLFPSGELFDVALNTGWVLRKPVKLKELSEFIDYSMARRPDYALSEGVAV